MTAQKSLAHVVSATVPRAAWPMVWYGLTSVKARLQSVDSQWGFRISTMAVDDDHVEVDVETLWESEVELAVWSDLQEIERFFAAVEPPAEDVRTRIMQVLA